MGFRHVPIISIKIVLSKEIKDLIRSNWLSPGPAVQGPNDLVQGIQGIKNYNIKNTFLVKAMCYWKSNKLQINVNSIHVHGSIRGSNWTFITIWANSADDKLMTFFHFPHKTGFDISCKLSPLKTTCMECQILLIICMKCKNLLSEKNEKTKKKKKKKKKKKCYLLKILHWVLSLKTFNCQNVWIY